MINNPDNPNKSLPFLNILMAQVPSKPGQLEDNINKAVEVFRYAQSLQDRPHLVVFPELFMTGSRLKDIFLNNTLQQTVQDYAHKLAHVTHNTNIAIIIGAPWLLQDQLYNASLFMKDGKIAAFRCKVHLSQEEKRYFVSDDHFFTTHRPVRLNDISVGLPIGQDIEFPDVIEGLKNRGTHVAIHTQASCFEQGIVKKRHAIIQERAKEQTLSILSVNTVGGCDDVVFDGSSLGVNEDGKPVIALPSFEACVEPIIWIKQSTLGYKAESEVEAKQEGRNIHNMLPMMSVVEDGVQELYQALVTSVRDYVYYNHFSSVVLGLSGGIDSALTCAIAADALGPSMVHTFMITSIHTSQSSVHDAEDCARNLGVSHKVLSLESMKKILETTVSSLLTGHILSVPTQESLQTRLRALFLITLSSQMGSLLLSTINKSELLTGVSTLYGDICGGFAPLKDIYKTKIYALSQFRNASRPKGCIGRDNIVVIPQNILIKPPTAELSPFKKDADVLPPYDVIDSILMKIIEQKQSIVSIIEGGEFEPAMVKKITYLVRRAQYKFNQSPVGPKVTSGCLGIDVQYPITSMFHEIKEVQE